MQADDDRNQTYYTNNKFIMPRGSDRDQFRADGSRKEFGWSITAQPRETGVLRLSCGRPSPYVCGPDNSEQASPSPRHLGIVEPQSKEWCGTGSEALDFLLAITVLAILTVIPLAIGLAVTLKALAYFGFI